MIRRKRTKIWLKNLVMLCELTVSLTFFSHCSTYGTGWSPGNSTWQLKMTDSPRIAVMWTASWPENTNERSECLLKKNFCTFFIDSSRAEESKKTKPFSTRKFLWNFIFFLILSRFSTFPAFFFWRKSPTKIQHQIKCLYALCSILFRTIVW